jgi:hypothetical protein
VCPDDVFTPGFRKSVSPIADLRGLFRPSKALLEGLTRAERGALGGFGVGGSSKDVAPEKEDLSGLIRGRDTSSPPPHPPRAKNGLLLDGTNILNLRYAPVILLVVEAEK